MSKELDKEAERKLEQVLKQIQLDYHCSFSEAVGIAKKWIQDYAYENGNRNARKEAHNIVKG
ncbi:TPA: hypothetical protein ACMY33_001283 [Yersinia enterocolitica]